MLFCINGIIWKIRTHRYCLFLSARGCCSVLGNLWDVTDKDIDKFSERVFDEIGLGCGSSDDSQEGSWISKAVSRSRDVCHLKYLNGAAPVVYGLPMRFK